MHRKKAGYLRYYDTEDRMLEVKKNTIDEFNRTFQIENGQLTFAYYESKTTQIRLYYKNGMLFRWIQTENGGDPVIHDMETDNPEFMEKGNMGLRDFSNIYNS